MFAFLIVPVVVGIAAVVQSGLNRQIGQRWGLAGSVALTSAVLFAAAVLLLAVSRWAPSRLPGFFNAPPGEKSFELWFLIPGLLGLVIVAGFPWAIHRAGATLTFVVAIAVQMMVSLAWDIAVEGQPFSWVKAAGAVLAIAGAGVTTLGR